MSLELSGTTPAIKGVAGSVSAPAITGDDVDTGISFPSANTIKFSTNGVERMTITDSGITGVSGGKVLQVVQTVKKDVFSGTIVEGGTDRTGDITGLTVTITPSNANNKILLMPSVSVSNTTGFPQILFYKDGSILTDAIGDAANKSYDNSALERMTFGGPSSTYGTHVLTGNFLDTAGGTSAITYSMRITNAKHGYGADISVYVNRAADADEWHNSYRKVARFISTFTAMEIAA